MFKGGIMKIEFRHLAPVSPNAPPIAELARSAKGDRSGPHRLSRWHDRPNWQNHAGGHSSKPPGRSEGPPHHPLHRQKAAKAQGTAGFLWLPLGTPVKGCSGCPDPESA